MTGPKPKKPPMSEDDSLAVEAYGKKGAAMRKTAAKIGEAESTADSEKPGFISNLLKHFQ